MLSQNKLYVVEWNPSAKQIHIQTIDKTISTNLEAIKDFKESGFVPDYLIVGITDSREEADKMADIIEKEFNN